jgi:hypothetical protein
VVQPVATNGGWRLSLLNVGGGPLVFATVGAAAQRFILAPSLHGLGNGAARRARLRSAAAAASDPDADDARVRTRASAAAAAAGEPSVAGMELSDAGLFGNNDRKLARIMQAKRVARRVLEREIGGSSYGREKVEGQLAKHVSALERLRTRLTVAGARAGVEPRSHCRVPREAVRRTVLRRRVVLHRWRE